jgi:hypothetical protein
MKDVGGPGPGRNDITIAIPKNKFNILCIRQCHLKFPSRRLKMQIIHTAVEQKRKPPPRSTAFAQMFLHRIISSFILMKFIFGAITEECP